MIDETECLERADRLISEGVIGDRGLIASMILEAVHQERERCAKVAEQYGPQEGEPTEPWGKGFVFCREQIVAAIKRGT